jgi:DegV family protein with EDD domain
MDKAIAQLKEQYPERTIHTIDTKGITILSLNIVKEIGELYLQNKSIEEIKNWANDNVDRFATYFFADDLTFFSKSGRISNVSKVFGNLLGIKPIIYMDDKGTMTNIGKEKGKQNALKKLLQYYDELSVDQYNHTVIIGHTDSYENASKLGAMLLEKYGSNLKIEYAVVNPTAGSHCGPECIGIAFYAKHK